MRCSKQSGSVHRHDGEPYVDRPTMYFFVQFIYILKGVQVSWRHTGKSFAFLSYGGRWR